MNIKKSFVNITASAFLLMSVSSFANTTPTHSAQPLTPSQVKQIQTVIHDYLLKNPQIMVEVIHELQKQQQNSVKKNALTAIHANTKALFNDSKSPVAGNKKGLVTLVEFFDYQCPHCKEMASVVKDCVRQDKNLKVIFKEFPIFPGSTYAAQAALAANMQGKYFEFHNALMADKNPLTKADVLATAKRVGLDVTTLEQDMNTNSIKNELTQNIALAKKLGLPGTPAFIIQSNKDKNKTFFVPEQISLKTLKKLISKAS